MTHRQHKAWQAWLLEEWNHPNRSDHYLAQIACEVRRVPRLIMGGDASAINSSQFVIPFEIKAKPVDTRTDAQKLKDSQRAHKEMWIAMVGGDPAAVPPSSSLKEKPR